MMGRTVVNFFGNSTSAKRPAPHVNVKSPPIQPKPDATAADGSVAAIQTWSGDEIAVEIQSGNLAGAYRVWRSATSNVLPRLKDMSAPEAKAALDDMVLLMKHDDDYIFVSQSANYIRNIGRDLRGCLMSDIKISTTGPMKAIYNTCFEKRQPIYARYVSELSQQSVYWEALILPLAADDSGRPMYCLNLVSLIDDKTAILQAVFDRAPMGMIVAAPTRSENGQIEDGKILSINTRAKNMLRLSQSQRQVQTIRQLGPWFRDGTEWTRIGMTTMEGGCTKIRYRDSVAKNFEVTIEAFSRFVLFSIIELQ
jgi:PAS domain-containing protein